MLPATATDLDGMVAFYDNGTLLGTSTTAPYSHTWNNAPAGAHQLTAMATDNHGAAITSTAIAITVNTPPAVSLTSPLNGSTYNQPANITLSANATDSDGTITKVEFYAGNTLIGTRTTAPYSIIWNNAPAGVHQLTAQATDNLGAITTSTAVAISINATPAISFTSPANNSVFITPATITLSANASDSDGTITQVEFYDGATLLATATVAPYGYVWNNAPLGLHQIIAKATDNQGAITVVAVNITVAVPAQEALLYIETDHLDTPRQLSDSSGRVVWRWDSTDAFGANLPNDDPDGDGTKTEFNLRMPGQYADKETSTFYNYLRDGYDPTLGRFNQTDPIGLWGGSFSTYTYVGGNPLSYKDPSGLIVRVATSDPVAAKVLMEAYARLNRTKRGMKITQQLECSKDVYEIRQIKEAAYYCPPGTTDKACHGKERTVFLDPYNNPILPTTEGMQSTSKAVVLGHELGHAIGYDDAPDPGDGMENVNANENPIRDALKEARRTQYFLDAPLQWVPGTR